MSALAHIPPTHAVGRVAALVTRATTANLRWIVVRGCARRGVGRNGISRCGTDTRPQRSLQQGARRTCSVVNVRAPAIPPEQPDYLGRDRAVRQIGTIDASVVVRGVRIAPVFG